MIKYEHNCLNSWLKQKENNLKPWEIVNLYAVYELKWWPYSGTNDFAIAVCLFGAGQLTKNVDLDKSFYSRCGIGFDILSLFSLADGSDFGKHVILLGVDNK